MENGEEKNREIERWKVKDREIKGGGGGREEF